MRQITFFISAIFLISLCTSQCNDGQIDINTASLEELDKLNGIGTTKAQAIIDARPYSSVDDLDKATGIGPKILEKVKAQGLACVNTKEVGKEADEEINKETLASESSEEIEEEITSRRPLDTQSVQEIQEIKQTESIINLNPDSNNKKKVIYESRSELIRKYSVYVFIAFLLIVIAFLLLRKNERSEDCRFDDC